MCQRKKTRCQIIATISVLCWYSKGKNHGIKNPLLWVVSQTIDCRLPVKCKISRPFWLPNTLQLVKNHVHPLCLSILRPYSHSFGLHPHFLALDSQLIIQSCPTCIDYMYWVFSVMALSGTEIWIWGVPHQGISPEILWPSQDCTRVNTCANQTVPLRHSISRSWDTLAILGQSVLEWHIHTAHRLSEYPEILKYSDDPRTVPRWSGYLKILGYSDKGINAVFSRKNVAMTTTCNNVHPKNGMGSLDMCE